MARKDLTKWGKRHPQIVLAAANLKISGVSERAIFERYRDLLSDAPSYRELRSALASKGAVSKRQATDLRRARSYFAPDGKTYTAEKSKGGTSRYLARRNDRIANPTPSMRKRLADNTILGRTLAAEDDPKAYKDERVLDFLTSEYEGYPA